MYKKDVSQLIMLSILWLWKLRMGNGVKEFVVPGGGKLLYRALHHLTPPPPVMMTMVSIVETLMFIKIGLYWAVLGCSGLHWTDKNWVFGGGEKGEGEGTRSSWLNCAWRDDKTVYWVSIRHYEAVAVGNWWLWVSRGHLCLFILHKVEIWSGVTHPWQTDWLTDNFER